MSQSARLSPSAVAIMVLLCALWGFQQVAIKVGHQGGMPSVMMAAMRSAGAGLLLCGWIVWRHGAIALVAMLRPRVLGPGLVIGVLFGVEFLALFPGVALTTAARGVLFLYTAPFFTALFAHFFLPQERLRPRQIVGLVIAFSGVALAFADGLGNAGGSLLGDAMCATAGVLWGATTVFIKANPTMRSERPECMLLYQLAVSAVVIGTAAWLLGDIAGPAGFSEIAWVSLFYQTVIVTFASYLAWFQLVSRNQAAALSGLTFLAPLFGIAAGHVILGEPASPALLVGLVAVAVGMRGLLGR